MRVVSLRDARIARALDVMKREPARRWTVAELARVAGMSRATFARHFRRSVGAAPLAWLGELRMRVATEYLLSTNEKLAAVAARVGYASEFAFAKAFKRAFGISPGRYRGGLVVRAAA